MRIEIGNGYGDLSAVSFGLGATVQYWRLRAALLGDDLNSPTLAENSLPIEPRYSLLLELTGKSSVLVTGRLTVEDRRQPRFGLGQLFRLGDPLGFFWGIEGHPTQFGAGIDLHLGRPTLTYATSVHPALGFSHTITISLGRRRARAEGIAGAT